LVPVFVLSLVFSRGEPLLGIAVVLLAGLAASLLLGNARTGANLRAVFARSETAGMTFLLIPATAVGGVFGGPVLMLLVVALAAAALLLVAFRGVEVLSGVVSTSAAPVEKSPTFPAQASDEIPPGLDLRELCRGLPPTLAGEVLATVDHLEAVEVQARRSGDARRSFDARQGLDEYLLGTVRAWKAQREDERDPAELARALTQIQRIAGSGPFSSESARRTWDTQQRFLNSRSGKPLTDPE